ncbi:MAG: branched-chain amino acid ABC transporter permease [Rhodomicrobium sp.]
MLAQQLANGVVAGSTYALFALGFTLMFGVLRVINLTYGFYFSAGAFLALYLTAAGAPVWLALPLASVLIGFGAILLDALLLTRLRRAKAPELASLMVTLGATLFLYSASTAIFGTDIRRFPPAVFEGGAFEIAGVRLTLSQFLIVGTAAASVAVLLFVMQGTRIGLAIRALAENSDATQLMGVNAGAVMRLVSFVSGSLGALAGILVGLNYNAIQPYMGEAMMLKGFAVIILGGLGDIRGALIAGLAVGLLESLTAGYAASTWKDAVGFVLLVLTLWVRPAGLFGRASVRRA